MAYTGCAETETERKRMLCWGFAGYLRVTLCAGAVRPSQVAYFINFLSKAQPISNALLKQRWHRFSKMSLGAREEESVPGLVSNYTLSSLPLQFLRSDPRSLARPSRRRPFGLFRG